MIFNSIQYSILTSVHTKVILDKQTNNKTNKTKNCQKEFDLDNIHPHSPIHLLLTNIISDNDQRRLTKATVSGGAKGSSASWTSEWRNLLLCDASRPPFSSKPLPLQIDKAATCTKHSHTQSALSNISSKPLVLQIDRAQITKCNQHFPTLAASHWLDRQGTDLFITKMQSALSNASSKPLTLHIDRAQITKCNKHFPILSANYCY